MELTSDLIEELLSFQSLTSRSSIAKHFNVSDKFLKFNLFNSSNRYHCFTIPKRTGGTRLIEAPRNELRYLQYQLTRILQSAIFTKPSCHGYSNNKSILTNAKSHKNKKFILNFDIEDFFGSINFGRVRGMFLSYPFECNDTVATTLAQICTHNNKLPQGAPTSPIISNIICLKLDSQMQALAKKYKCTYTRYSDDVTFSTNLKIFPPQIATLQEGMLNLSDEISNIVLSNGFRLNTNKTRLANKNQRMVVTGLKVNNKLNVDRRYIRNIRSVLQKLETQTVERVVEQFFSQYKLSRHKTAIDRDYFFQVIKGRIEFIGQVRGSRDKLYLGLCQRLAAVNPRAFSKKEYNTKLNLYINHKKDSINQETVKKRLVVIEEDKKEFINGTGFITEYGVITVEHCLKEHSKIIVPSRPLSRLDFEIMAKDPMYDFAILRTDVEENQYLNIDFNYEAKIGEKVFLFGFPAYSIGFLGNCIETKVTHKRIRFNVEHFAVDKVITGGMSGGPVVNINGDVIGIITSGMEGGNGDMKSDLNFYMPIKYLSSVLPENDKHLARTI